MPERSLMAPLPTEARPPGLGNAALLAEAMLRLPPIGKATLE